MITLHFHLQPQYKYELFHINFTKVLFIYLFIYLFSLHLATTPSLPLSQKRTFSYIGSQFNWFTLLFWFLSNICPKIPRFSGNEKPLDDSSWPLKRLIHIQCNNGVSYKLKHFKTVNYQSPLWKKIALIFTHVCCLYYNCPLCISVYHEFIKSAWLLFQSVLKCAEFTLQLW